MPEDSLEEWSEKAGQDFEYARVGMRQRKNPLYDGVCFHAQQCAGNYVKAFLVRHHIAFRKIHDRIELRRLCLQVDSTFSLITDPLKVLYLYAVDIRYPGITATKEDAQRAMEAMKQVRNFVRARLGFKTK